MSFANTLAVQSANKRTVSEVTSSQPDMSGTVTGWSEQLVFTKLLKKIVDRESVDERREFTCMGIVQPFSAQGLKIKPEGERSWKWWMLHTTTAVDLQNGEQFVLRGIQYRVMSRKAYFRNGYYEYELVETFSASNGRNPRN